MVVFPLFVISVVVWSFVLDGCLSLFVISVVVWCFVLDCCLFFVCIISSSMEFCL